MPSFSPGIAQGCLELLDVANRQRLVFANIHKEFTRLGRVSCEHILEASQQFGWLSSDALGIAVATSRGEHLLRMATYQEQLRQMLLDYVDAEHPPWVQNARLGRARVLRFVDTGLRQVMVEADLVAGAEDSVIAFWDTLGARARGLRDDHLLSIGREGERLSIRNERARTGHEPRWIAIDSNEDGYDVLSVKGPDSFGPLLIEVKASRLGMAGSFYLTRSEWDRARDAASMRAHRARERRS